MKVGLKKELNRETLLESTKILEKINYCIFYGSMLGIHRDGDVIDGDDDVDLLIENKDKRVKRYVYSDKKLENWEYIKYSNLYGNLWEKEIMLVKPKHRKMGLDKIKRMYVEI